MGHGFAVGAGVEPEVVQSGQVGQSLQVVGRLEAPGRMGQDQLHVGIVLAVVPDPVDVAGIGGGAGLDHVQGDGPALFVSHPDVCLGQVVGDLGLPGRVRVAGQGVVALQAVELQALDLLAHPLGIVLGSDEEMPPAVRILGGLLSRPLVGRGDIHGVAKGGDEQALGDASGIEVPHQSDVVLVVHNGRETPRKDVVARVPDMGVGVEHLVGNERGQFALVELPVFLARDIVGIVGCHRCLLWP